MKRIATVFVLTIASLVNAATFEDRSLGRRYDSEDDLISVGNDASIDSFEKVELFCEKKYPGFVTRSQKADWCIQGIKKDIDNIRFQASRMMPDRRNAASNYPTSRAQLEYQIKEAFKVTNFALVFDKYTDKKINLYFEELQKTIAAEQSEKLRVSEEHAQRNAARQAIAAEENAAMANKKAIEEQQRKHHAEQLRLRRITPSSFGEAVTYYSAESGYWIAVEPKLKPDGKAYVIDGRIELTPSKSQFIARKKRASSVSPYGNQVLREMQVLTGQTQEPYFSAIFSQPLLEKYQNNARVNGLVNLIGIYQDNTEILMANNTKKTIPVFNIIAVEFNSDGVIHYALPPKVQPAAQQKTQSIPPQNADAAGMTAAAHPSFLNQYHPTYNHLCIQQRVGRLEEYEKRGCDNKLIGKLEGLMDRTFNSRMAHPFAVDKKRLKGEQLDFSDKLVACQDDECLVKTYKARIKELCEIPVPSGTKPPHDCEKITD